MKKWIIYILMVLGYMVSINALELSFPKVIGNYTYIQNYSIINNYGTGGDFSNFQLANVSNTTSWSNIINIPFFSNFQLSNVSNTTSISRILDAHLLARVGDFNLGNISNTTDWNNVLNKPAVSNFQISNVSNTTAWSNIINIPAFSNFQYSNITLFLGVDNSSIVRAGNLTLYNKSIDLGNYLTTSTQYSNFQLENISNTTSWSNIINIPTFSNFQIANVSNDTLKKIDNLTLVNYIGLINTSMRNYIDNGTYNKSIDLSTYNYSVDLSGYLKSAGLGIYLTNNSPANLTNVNLYTLNGTALNLFNRSIDLSTYNKSIDLSTYNYSISLNNYALVSALGIYLTNNSPANLTNVNLYTLNGTSLNLFNRSIDLSTYNYSVSLNNYNQSVSLTNYLTKTDNTSLALWNLDVETLVTKALYSLKSFNGNFLFNATTGKLFIGTNKDYETSGTVLVYGDYDSYLNATYNLYGSDIHAGLSISTSNRSGASPLASNDSQYIGGITFYPYNGSHYLQSARINSFVKTIGTNSSTLGSDLTFDTKTIYSNTNNATERLRITSEGLIGIGTATPSSNLEINGNLTVVGKTNNTLGNFTIQQFNSSCAGFKFGTTGGLLLSCSP